jgi:hypothetical protein
MRLASMITTTTTAFHHPKTTMTMAMTTGTNLNTNTNAKTFNVAIIGGGITGSCAASMLTSFNNIKSNGSKQSEQHKHIEPMLSNLFGQQQDGQITSSDDDIRINVDLFDQGRSGVGGRTSHRRRKIQNNDGTDEHQHQALRWDHGCQVCNTYVTHMQHIFHMKILNILILFLFLSKMDYLTYLI